MSTAKLSKIGGVKQNRILIRGAVFVGMVLSAARGLRNFSAIYLFDNQEYLIFKIRKDSLLAKIPTCAASGDKGMKLHSIENKVVRSMETVTIRTGISVELPPDSAGLIWDRRESVSNGLSVMGGVFDANFRDELVVTVTNLSDADRVIRQGDGIAQLLIQKSIPIEQLS